MRYHYYPGCTLKDKARKMEESALASAGILGLQLTETEEWQCCGAVFPLTVDEIITLLSPARVLASAGDDTLVSLCAACHHVLKRTHERLRRDPEALYKINDYLGTDYKGEGRVLHFLELLKNDLGFDKLSGRVTNPLEGRRVAAYYGCLLLRPADIMQFDDAENPSVMEEYISCLGADPVIYPYRTECCGGYLSVTENTVAGDTTLKILRSVARAGADEIITACPLCLYNLEKTRDKLSVAGEIKVSYFPELLAEALGVYTAGREEKGR